MKFVNISYLFIVCSLCSILLSCKRINPDRPTYVGEQAPLPKATSEINLTLEIPLALFEERLNKNLQQELFSEKGMDLGNGLFSDVRVTKTGDLKLSSSENGNLRVSLPVFLDGKVTLEKKIFGQAVSASLPFKESLSPQVSFLPRIDENWGIQIDSLEIESWGKPFQYDLLGYQLDLEPFIKKYLTSILKNQLSSNLLTSLDLKSLAEKTWEVYGAPLHVKNSDLDIFLYTVPEKIRISEQFTKDQTLVLNLGLEGEVFTHTGERPVRKNTPFPNVFPNDKKENNLAITLPLALSYETMDRYLNKEMAGKVFRVDSKTNLIPHAFSTQSFGDRALVKMEFTAKRTRRKDVDGIMYLVGRPVYSEEREAIVLENINFDLNTQNFLTNSANWLRKNRIITAIQRQAVFPIGEYMEEAKNELSQLGSWQTEFANISLYNPDLQVDGIYTTDDDIRLYLRSTGDIQVRLK